MIHDIVDSKIMNMLIFYRQLCQVNFEFLRFTSALQIQEGSKANVNQWVLSERHVKSGDFIRQVTR